MTLDDAARVLREHRHDGRDDWEVGCSYRRTGDREIVVSLGEPLDRNVLSSDSALIIAAHYRRLDAAARERRIIGDPAAGLGPGGVIGVGSSHATHAWPPPRPERRHMMRYDELRKLAEEVIATKDTASQATLAGRGVAFAILIVELLDDQDRLARGDAAGRGADQATIERLSDALRRTLKDLMIQGDLLPDFLATITADRAVARILADAPAAKEAGRGAEGDGSAYLPCPFCGGEATPCTELPSGLSFVKCDDCDAQTPAVGPQRITELRPRWNRRTPAATEADRA